MKHWRVDYSLKTACETIDCYWVVKAETIRLAIDEADRFVREEIESREDVIDSCVWGVEIIEDDVF